MPALFTLPLMCPDTWQTMILPWVDGIPPKPQEQSIEISKEDEDRMRVIANLLIDRFKADRQKRLAIEAKSVNDVA